MKEKILSLFDAKMWKFLLVGVLNTVVGNGLMLLLLNLTSIGRWPSSAIGYVVGSIVSYFLNRYFTFKYKGGGYAVIFRFALNIAVCYGLSYGIAYFIAQPLIHLVIPSASDKLLENISSILGSCLFVGFNYIGQRFFAFRETDEK